MSPDSSPPGRPHPVRLPVRTLERVHIDASRTETEAVFCPGQCRSMHIDTCRDCERLMAFGEDGIHCTPDPGAVASIGAPAGSDVSVGEAMGCAAFLVDAELPAAAFARALHMPGHRVAVVVDEAQRALGLVEVAVAAAALEHTTVQDLVRQVACIHEGTPLARAIDRMVHERVRALPVVDDEGRVVGLLTNLDALHWVAHRNPRREGP